MYFRILEFYAETILNFLWFLFIIKLYWFLECIAWLIIFDMLDLHWTHFINTLLFPSQGQGDFKDPVKEAEIKRRQCCIKKFQSRNQRGVLGTPPPVKGRKNEQIQTEKYLEEVQREGFYYNHWKRFLKISFIPALWASTSIWN